MDSPNEKISEQQFHGRPTIDHSKRIQVAMAGVGLAIVLALLNFEPTPLIKFAISCFAVSIPISAVFAAKFEVDDPRDWFKNRIYSKFLYGLTFVIFVLGIAAVFASGSRLYLLLFVLSCVLAGNLWQSKSMQKTVQDSASETEKDSTNAKRAA